MKKKFFALTSIILLKTLAQATSLEEALSNAYQNNPDLIAAREELKKNDEKIFKAASGFIPKIEYNFKDKHGQTDTAYINGKPTYDQWYNTKVRTSNFSLDQNLYEGGKTLISLKITKYFIEAERFKLISKEQETLLKAIDAYYSVLAAKEKLDMSKENVIAYDKKYQFVKAKFDQGFAKQADVANALSRKSDAETNLADFEAKYRASLSNYIEVIGLEPENLLPEKPLVTVPHNEEDFLHKSIKFNPELNRSNYTQKYLDLTVKYNMASMLPSVNLNAETSKIWENKAAQSIAQPYTNNRSVSVNVKIPIYQQGVEYSNVRASKAEAAKAKYDNKNAKAILVKKVTQSWYDFLSAKQMVKSSQDAVNASEIAIKGKQQEYDEGNISLNELLEIQDNLFKYRVKFVDASKNLVVKQYYISAVEGGLTAKALKLPTKLYNPAENYERVKTKLIGF